MTKFEEIMTKTGQAGMAKYVAEREASVCRDVGRLLGTIFPAFSAKAFSAEEFEALVIEEFNRLNEEV